jgi:phage terminase small subunit
VDKNANNARVVANTDPLHVLNDMQRIFVAAIVRGDTPRLAAQKAGYSRPITCGDVALKSKKIQAAIRFSYAKNAQAAQMTRQKVMDGLLESISIAKLQADAGVMVAGWREIGKMCGFYAPEVRKIDISVTTRRVVDQLETLSDDELLKIVDEAPEALEGEASRVLDEGQELVDAPRAREFGLPVPG